MKKAISLMLALIMALSMLGITAIAEGAAAESTPAPTAEATAAPEQAPPAKETSKEQKLALDKGGIVIYQTQTGKSVPESGFPMVKGNKLVVRIAIVGGAEKAVAKGRVSIGPDAKNKKKDIASVLIEKTKLSGKTEFAFSLKALKALKEGKDYKVFFQSAKTKTHPAIGRTQIGTVKVVSAKDADKTEPAESADDNITEETAPADAETAAETEAATEDVATEDVATEAAATEAAAAEDVAAMGAIAKDLRQLLTPTFNSMEPATGVLTAPSYVNVYLDITGGVKDESVTGQLVLLDSAGEVVAGTGNRSIATKATKQLFTFTKESLVNLKSGQVYDIALTTDPANAKYAPHTNTKLNKTITAPTRVDREALGAWSLSKTEWNLVTDKETDVVLTIAACDKLTKGAVPATFTLRGEDLSGNKLPISPAKVTLSTTEATTVTFKAADLLTLAPGAWPIEVKTDATDAYLAGPDNEKPSPQLTLTIRGDGRTAISFGGGTVNSAKTSKYKPGSADALAIKGFTSSVDAVLPLVVTIYKNDGVTKLASCTVDLPAKGGDINVPAATLNEAGLTNTDIVIDDTTTPPTTEEQPYKIKVAYLGSELYQPATLMSAGELFVGANDAKVITLSAAKLANATANLFEIPPDSGKKYDGFWRARGASTRLPLDVNLGVSRDVPTSETIAFTGQVIFRTVLASGNAGSTVWTVDIPESKAKITGSGTNKVAQIAALVDLSAADVNANLPDGAKGASYFIGLKINGNDKLKPYEETRVGMITVSDGASTLPVYNGKAEDTLKWTNGGSGTKELKNYVSFEGGVGGRTMTASIYAAQTDYISDLYPKTVSGTVTKHPATNTTTFVKIASGITVHCNGGTASVKIKASALNKLAAGKSYRLYIQGDETTVGAVTFNKTTQIGKSGTKNLGYMGKLTVAAKPSGGGGGGGSGGSSGGSTDDNGTGGDNTGTDGGTDSVTEKDTAADTAAADQIAFGTYQTLDKANLEWMLARQPLMGREFLKYLLNQKGSQKIAIPLAYVADMTDPVKVPIVGGGQYDLGLAVFTPAKEGETTGYTFTVEPKTGADMANLKLHLGADFEDLARTLTDADYYKPGDFVPVSTLKLVQLDGAVTYDATKAEQVKIDSEVTNRITEWMAQG